MDVVLCEPTGLTGRPQTFTDNTGFVLDELGEEEKALCLGPRGGGGQQGGLIGQRAQWPGTRERRCLEGRWALPSWQRGKGVERVLPPI